ncbi:Uncharacterized protein OBRU01_09419 [Operophtera brumata]|uniref:SAM domain-containing protein n=1 Tax=Operophtera brumata TaxID=104452 RepID=A0A0L7L2W4_OPEBR|nr:Uncharacterized protein OBRU01_09419 [Operophtera brumata]
MDSKLTGMWVSFFTAAGIPSDVSATYALTFTENRIQSDMLLDLNKEYLKDMGIVRMGDVIAILRHSKQVHEHTARDKVLSSAASVGNKVPVAAVTARTTVTQPSSRKLQHRARDKVLSSAASVGNKVPVAAVTARTTVTQPSSLFSRLGNNEPVHTITTKATGVQPAKPIYARLGSKSDASQDVPNIPIPKDALKYEGILKSPPTPTPKNLTVTTTKNARKIFTMRADEEPVSVKDKLALPKAKSVKFSNHIQYKEIEKIGSTATKAPRPTQIFNKPERRLTMPEGITADGVKSRLGLKTINNLTITKNVFKRLGEV